MVEKVFTSSAAEVGRLKKEGYAIVTLSLWPTFFLMGLLPILWKEVPNGAAC